jgi:DNA-binding NarL/FixJ family response regulator
VADPIRVLIVDDHASFAESLRDVLGRRPGVEVTAIAETAADAVRLADETAPNVVLMDQHLPDRSGAHAAREILARRPDTAIVVLTGGGSEDEMLEAVEAGVCGYLVKTARVAEVAAAIERAAAGEMLIPSVQLSELLRRAQARRSEGQDRARVIGSLTAREREVLRCMAKAQDTNAIAEELTISRHTARGHVQTIIEKLGAHSRLEAVLRGQELGLLGG